MKDEKHPLTRSPSAEARAKAREAKRANLVHRTKHLHEVLVAMEGQLNRGELPRESVSHQAIYRQASVSPATYWRYLKNDERLRVSVAALTGNASRRDTGLVGSRSLTTPSSDQDAASAEAVAAKNIQLSAVIINLQQQLAACKTLIGLMDLDLRAKTKEAASKDILLAAEREQTIRLAAMVKELGERCQSNGLEVGVELSSLFPTSKTRREVLGPRQSFRPRLVKGKESNP